MTFGERITKLRKENGYATRKSFCEKLGIPETTLRNYETDAREPGHTFLIKIANLFNVSVDYIMGLTEEKERIRAYELKLSEYEHVKKYRSLDSPGKERIDYELNKEFERIEQLQTQQDQIQQLKQRIVEDMLRWITLPFYIGFASAGSGEYLFDDIPTDTIKVKDTPTARDADFVIGVNGDSMEPDYCNGDKVFVKKTPNLDVGDVGIFLKGNDCYIKECGPDRLISRNKAYGDIWPDENIITIGKVIGKVEEP